MTTENKPLDVIKTKITSRQLVISELGTIKSKVAALQDALGVFEDIKTYGNMNATTDNAAVANATASTSATPENYVVQLTQAAQKGIYNITGLSTATDSISINATDGFQITVGSGASAVTYKSNGDKVANGVTTNNSVTALGANPTTTTLKDWINSISSQTNVTATISQASAGRYALIVSGSLEGESNNFTISGLITGTHAINFTSPDAKVILDATNGFQMTVGGVTYKTSGSDGTNSRVQSITGTGAGGVITVNDLKDWINARSTANSLGVSASVAGSGASYQLLVTQTNGTQGALQLSGVQPYVAISGYSQADGSDAVSIDATDGFALTVGNTVYNTKGTKTVSGITTNITQLVASPTIADLKDWINSVAGGDALATYEGSGANWSLAVKSIDSSEAISTTGLVTSTTRMNISDAGFASDATLVNLDESTGFVLTVGSHAYSTKGLKDGVADNTVGVLSSNATLTTLKDWINSLNTSVSASLVSNSGNWTLQLTQSGAISSDLAISGLRPNAVANGYATTTDALSTSLAGDVSAQTANNIGDRTITINDSDVTTGTVFRLSISNRDYQYTARSGDTGASVASALRNLLLVDYPDAKSLTTYPLETSRSQGAGSDETATIKFSAMKAGDSLTIAGLTMTAKRDLVASEVSAAFNGLQNGHVAPTETTIVKNRSSDPVTGLATIQVENVVNPTIDGLYRLTYSGDTLTMTRFINGVATASSSVQLITSGTADPGAFPPTILFNSALNEVTTLSFGAGFGSFDLRVTTAATVSQTANQLVNSIITATQAGPETVAGNWTRVMGADWADTARTNLGLGTSATLKAVITSKNNASLRIGSTTGLTASTGYGTLVQQQAGRTQLGFTGTAAQLDAALRTLEANSTDGLDQVEVFIVPDFITVYKNANQGRYDFFRQVTSSGNWDDARTAATGSTFNEASGYLAQLNNSNQFDFIYQRLQGSAISAAWIGATDTANEGRFIWQDGPLAGVEFYVGRKNGSTLESWSNPGNIQATATRVLGDLDTPESRTWSFEIVSNPSIATTPTSLALPGGKAITLELRSSTNGAIDRVVYTNNSGSNQSFSTILSNLNGYFTGSTANITAVGNYSIAFTNNSGETDTFGLFSRFDFTSSATSTTASITFTNKTNGNVTDGNYASFQLKGINQYNNFPSTEPNNGSNTGAGQDYIDLWLTNNYLFDDNFSNTQGAYIVQYDIADTNTDLDNIRRQLNLSAPGVIEVGNAAHDALGNNVLQYAAYSGTFSGYQVTTTQPSIVVTQGVNGLSSEQASVSFRGLSAGQSLSLAGLIFTAGANGATATQVAQAFANLANNASTGGGSSYGTYSGALSGWATGSNFGTSNITFTSATANTSVTDLVVDGTPLIDIRQGVSSASTETAEVTFSALNAGQTLTLAGLTFTAGIDGATAVQVAAAFGGIANNTAYTSLNSITAGGTFTAGTSADWSSGIASGTSVVYTSIISNSDVGDLTPSNTPSIQIKQGVTGISTEYADVTFSSLNTGQSITLGGLTFTAGATGASANQIAGAFASINRGTTASGLSVITNATHNGTFTSGSLENWSTGTATGSVVRFTSATSNANVADLSVNNMPVIRTTQGVSTPSTEYADVTFKNLSAGQTLTLAGLTFTAGSAGISATELANAFSNLIDGTTAASINQNANLQTLITANKGRFTSGSVGSWITSSNSGTVTRFTSIQANADVADLVVINDTLSFTSTTSGSDVTNLSAAIVNRSALTVAEPSPEFYTRVAGVSAERSSLSQSGFRNLSDEISNNFAITVAGITYQANTTNTINSVVAAMATSGLNSDGTSYSTLTDLNNWINALGAAGVSVSSDITGGAQFFNNDFSDIHVMGVNYPSTASNTGDPYHQLYSGTAPGVNDPHATGTTVYVGDVTALDYSNMSATVDHLIVTSSASNVTVTAYNSSFTSIGSQTQAISGLITAGSPIALTFDAIGSVGGMKIVIDPSISTSSHANATDLIAQSLQYANKQPGISGWLTFTAGSGYTLNIQGSNTGTSNAVSIANLSGTDGVINTGLSISNTTNSTARDGVREQYTVNFRGLRAGNSIQLSERNGGSITFTATRDLNANQVAQAFANLSAGGVGSTVHGMFASSGGGLAEYTSAAANGSLVRFTSLTESDTTGLSMQVSSRSASTTVQTAPLIADGNSYVTESAQYSFNQAGIRSGDSVTIGGLTFTANRTITAAELAKAFANLSENADTGFGVAYGKYSGNLVGYSSGLVLANNEVLFTSSAQRGMNPGDISASAIVKSLELENNTLTFTALGAQLGTSVINLNGDGPFQLTVGNTTYSSIGRKTVGSVVTDITSLENFTPNATITDLRDWINSVVPAADAQAQIVQKGATYSLQVNSKNTTDRVSMSGLASATSIESNYPVSTEDRQIRNASAIAGTILGSGINIDRYSTGRDARFTIGGIEYQRSSNAISDVITGVTLNLMGTAGTANIKVSLGEDHSEKAITDLADAYNALIKAYNTMTANSANSTTPGTFATSPTTLSFIENIKRRFATGATYNIGSVDSNGFPYILSLASLGLDYQLDGTLKYNSVNYLISKSDGLREKFLKGLRIGYASPTDNLMTFIKAQSASGRALAQEMAIEKTSVNSLTKEQENLQIRLNKIQENYIAQFSGLNALLFQLNSTSTSLGNALDSLKNLNTGNNT